MELADYSIDLFPCLIDLFHEALLLIFHPSASIVSGLLINSGSEKPYKYFLGPSSKISSLQSQEKTLLERTQFLQKSKILRSNPLNFPK